MPFNKKQTYCQVPNNDFDLRIPLHSDESFQHGIVFQAKAVDVSCHEGKAFKKKKRGELRALRDHGNVDPTAHPIHRQIEPDARRCARINRTLE
ncbi:hypothetical protein OUZ56_028155 [Daphnia magna]|uniref:Uncharacterized protein n=1 Tax=Daphnia magna TaxID=35525 RepID=A0ABR0B310_9CRUS|nr:hypothetical protein OUZ56_028155 [Daphnia magna]